MHMSTPTVSIGIPVYNGEKYVERAVDSVLEQTFDDFELIISDNASTDSTPEIASHYSKIDDRIKYRRNSENKGAAKNFNITFGEASGQYFKWLSSDEWIEPTFLQKCVDKLRDDESLVATYTYCTCFDEGPIEVDCDLNKSTPYERFVQMMECGIILHVPIWSLFRRGELKKTELIKPFVGADEWLLIDLSISGKFGVIRNHLHGLRTHENAFHTIPKYIDGEKDVRAAQAEWFNPNNQSPNVHRLRWHREILKIILRSRCSWRQKYKMLAYLSTILWRDKRTVLEEIRQEILYGVMQEQRHG